MSAVAVERVLAQSLEQEWAAQSGGRAALVVTPAVREAVELLARSAIDVAGDLREGAATPAALVDRIRDRLSESPDPWALRMLTRMPAVAPAAPRLALPSPQPPPALVLYEPALPPAVVRPAPTRSRWAGLRAALHLGPRVRTLP